MKQCCTVLLFCALVAGCDHRSPTGPIASAVRREVPPSVYTLSGRIVEADGSAVAGAVVELAGETPGLTTVSDEGGLYRFENVGGFFVLRVTKAEYSIALMNVWIQADQALTVTLQRALVLIPGVPLRGTVQAPPCDPNWDARALCERISFTPPDTDEYEIVLTWNGTVSQLDLLIDGAIYFDVGPGPGELRGQLVGPAGVQREIRIHSYYSPQAFELTARKTAP